ncbi:MAG TPA: pilus assembly protein N-terminal domain-containing protein [Bryobacteraceae bacterium]
MRKRKAQLAAAIAIGSVFGLFFVTGAAGWQAPPPPQQPAPPQQAAQPGVEEAPNDLVLTVGKSLVVNSSLPIERVSVGFGDVAEATAVGIREILVNGKAPGETSLIIWQQGGAKLFFDVRVEASPFARNARLEALIRELNLELPGQEIAPTIENDLIFLRGRVKDLTSAERAFAISSSMGKSVNLLQVQVPAPDPQILLRVKFASVDRNKLTNLGINLFSLGQTLAATSTQQFSPPVIGGSSSGSSGSSSGSGSVTGSTGAAASLSNLLNIFVFNRSVNLGATIQALEQKGLAEILAEPNVLAYNGRQASFLAGGEFPYPVVQGGTLGGTTAVTIQFRQFGIRLNFIPTITPRGTIRLQVNPEVSALDYAQGVTISGFTVPGIDVRSVNTEVELGEEQSFALSGLLDSRETETFSKIPLIGDIPILGKLFQSKSTNKTNTELIVIVTPEIVRPAPPNIAIQTPNYPAPFLPQNSTTPMSTPGLAVTGPVPVTPPTPTVPVETLVKSLQETPLTVTSTSGTFGQAQPTGNLNVNVSPTPAPAPAPAAPPQ